MYLKRKINRDYSITYIRPFVLTGLMGVKNIAYQSIHSYDHACQLLGHAGSLKFEGLNKNKKSFLGALYFLETEDDLAHLNRLISKLTCFDAKKLRTILTFKKKGEPGSPPSLISNIYHLREDLSYAFAFNELDDLDRLCELIDYKKADISHPFNQIRAQKGKKVEFHHHTIRSILTPNEQVIGQIVCD